MMALGNWCLLLFSISALVLCSLANEKKARKINKDPREYTDSDLERLYQQWEEDEEPLPDDELPEHLRPQPPIDFSKMDPNNPEAILQASKKGKSTMLFATVSGNPEQEELEDVTGLWQTSLYNNHIDAQRFAIDGNRVIFMFKDGSQAWEAKDFLIKQDRCEEVTLESKNYPGKAAPKPENEPKKEL